MKCINIYISLGVQSFNFQSASIYPLQCLWICSLEAIESKLLHFSPELELLPLYACHLSDRTTSQ